MKKGAVPLQVIIIGLLVLVIVGFAFIPKIPEFYKKTIAPIFGVVPKEETIPSPVKVKPSAAVSYLELDSDYKKATRQLAEAASFCWDRMKATKAKKLICNIVMPIGIRATVEKKDVMEQLKIINKPAYSALWHDWKIPSSIKEFTPSFYICADYESEIARDQDRDLAFTYDLSPCGIDEKMTFFPNPAPFFRLYDLIILALDYCWTDMKKQHYTGPCAYFDTSLMLPYNPNDPATSIKKRDIIKDLKELEEEKVISEGAADTLDDWWKLASKAKMEYTISERSKPFFVCAAYETGANELCLTHDINNDCCTG